MASPAVAAVTEGSTNTAGTSHAVTLPAGGSADDEYIVIMDIGSTAATLNALTDWTELLDENVANGLKILVYDGAGVPSNPTFTSSASTRSAWIAYRITGADKTVTPQIGTTSTGTSATPDPPASATPPSSKDYLFIAFAGMAGEEADDDTWGNTPPTNYTPSPPRQKSCGTAGTNLGGLILSAERQLTTGVAENPGTFGVDVSAAWRAQTITVHPDLRIFVSGGVATENDSSVGGTIIQPQAPVAGGVASEQDSAPAAQVQQVYTAAPVGENDSAPAGTVDQASGTTVNGGVASESDSVPAGQVAQVYTAGPVAESDSVAAGQVLQRYTAGPASEQDAALAGTVQQGSQQTVAGGRALESDSVLAGRVLQIYTATPVGEVDTAPGGSVIQPMLVFGGTASETDSVLVGTVIGGGVIVYGLIEGATSVGAAEAASGSTTGESSSGSTGQEGEMDLTGVIE